MSRCILKFHFSNFTLINHLTMEVLESKKSLADYIEKAKSQRKSIGFAPTMGALHKGHLSLYEAARKENDTVISSIFINPTQFNNTEDLEKYPRTLEADLHLLRESGNVDAVYIPRIEDLYPNGAQSKHYNFDGLESEMEGRFRPGHFDGVGTVIEELFMQVKPDDAYFGEKDYQQLLIIQKLVEKLNLAVKIHGVPIYREQNGLAMSSRNERLTLQQRQAAKLIHETLVKVNDWFRILTIPEIYRRVAEIFEKTDEMVMEYFMIADEKTLKEANFFYEGKDYRAFLVVFVGEVRLIDNMHLD